MSITTMIEGLVTMDPIPLDRFWNWDVMIDLCSLGWVL